MSSVQTHQIAEQVISRVLEDAAFVFTDKCSHPPVNDPTWSAWGVELSFIGKPSGVLRMWASEGFAGYVAANMLGLESDSADAKHKGLDALKEVLNMIVGNLITEMFGTELVFDLSIPVQLPLDQLEIDKKDPTAIWLEGDDNVIMFMIKIRP